MAVIVPVCPRHWAWGNWCHIFGSGLYVCTPKQPHSRQCSAVLLTLSLVRSSAQVYNIEADCLHSESLQMVALFIQPSVLPSSAAERVTSERRSGIELDYVQFRPRMIDHL